MYYINTLKQEIGTAKTYEHNLLDKKYVVDRHRCYMAAKFGVFVDEDHSKLPTLIINREVSLYLACNEKHAFVSSEQPRRFKLWSCQKVCDDLHYLLDNIFITFG